LFERYVKLEILKGNQLLRERRGPKKRTVIPGTLCNVFLSE
jgi:hypothetical protein